MFYFNLYRFYGHLIRVNSAFKKSSFVTIISLIIRFNFYSFGSSAYLYRFNSDNSPCSKNFMFITPILDYKFFNNFLPLVETSCSSQIFLLTFLPIDSCHSFNFTLIQSFGFKRQICFSSILAFFKALFSLNFKSLLHLHYQYLSDSMSELMSLLNFSSYNIYLSDPVNPTIAYLAYRLKKIKIPSVICLNSPHLLPFEYLYYSCFPIASIYPKRLFFSKKNIGILISPTFFYHKVHNTATSNSNPNYNKTPFLFISQPYEQRSFVLRFASMINEVLILLMLCIKFLIHRLKNKHIFIYRSHPRDSSWNIKKSVFSLFVLLYPDMFAFSPSSDSLASLLQSTSLAFTRDSTAGIDYMLQASKPKLYVFSRKYHLSLSNQFKGVYYCGTLAVFLSLISRRSIL